MALIGFMGDLHGYFDVIEQIMDKNPFVDRWFQVGDLGGEYDNYPLFPLNFHFIQGNHENWEYIRSLKMIESTVFLPNGSITRYKDNNSSYTIAAMGGNYSPKFFYQHNKSKYHHNSKHFSLDEFEALYRRILRFREIDVLITHEAPSPFFKFQNDIGIPEITRLALKVNPFIHIFGHHHQFKVLHINGLLSICLDYGYKSYLLYDTIKKLVKVKKFKK